MNKQKILSNMREVSGLSQRGYGGQIGCQPLLGSGGAFILAQGTQAVRGTEDASINQAARERGANNYFSVVAISASPPLYGSGLHS